MVSAPEVNPQTDRSRPENPMVTSRRYELAFLDRCMYQPPPFFDGPCGTTLNQGRAACIFSKLGFPSNLGGSSNGRTQDSDSCYLGSNPCPPTKIERSKNLE